MSLAPSPQSLVLSNEVSATNDAVIVLPPAQQPPAGVFHDYVTPTAIGFTPTIYSPAYQRVNTDVLKACRQSGMRLIPWTVNDMTKLEELRRLGVDGIITDYPDLFRD